MQRAVEWTEQEGYLEVMSGRVKAAFFFFGTVLLDQLVKYCVELTMLPGESIPIVPPFFHITFVLNPGAAFGIFEYQQWLFLVTAAVFCAVFLAPQRDAHPLWIGCPCGRSREQYDRPCAYGACRRLFRLSHLARL